MSWTRRRRRHPRCGGIGEPGGRVHHPDRADQSSWSRRPWPGPPSWRGRRRRGGHGGVCSSASDGKASSPRSDQSCWPGGVLGSAAVGLDGVGPGDRVVVATGVSGSPDSWTLTSSPATDPGRAGHRVGQPHALADPGACERTTRSWVGSTTPNSRTGAGSPRAGSGHQGPDRVVEDARVQLGADTDCTVTRGSASPGTSSSDVSRSDHWVFSGSMPPLSRATGACRAGARRPARWRARVAPLRRRRPRRRAGRLTPTRPPWSARSPSGRG